MIIFCFFVFVVSAGFLLFACFYVFGYALKKKKIFFCTCSHSMMAAKPSIRLHTKKFFYTSSNIQNSTILIFFFFILNSVSILAFSTTEQKCGPH